MIYLAQVLGVSIAVIAIIYSAVKMMMADGPLEARQERKSLIEAVMALVVIALAVPITNWLLAAFGAGLQIPRGGWPCSPYYPSVNPAIKCPYPQTRLSPYQTPQSPR